MSFLLHYVGDATETLVRGPLPFDEREKEANPDIFRKSLVEKWSQVMGPDSGGAYYQVERAEYDGELTTAYMRPRMQRWIAENAVLYHGNGYFYAPLET